MAWSYSYDTASGRADFLSRLNTWLTGTVGWTLHDDQSGGSPAYMIWRSTGEASNQEIYVRMWISTSANRMGFSICRYWDNASHTAYNESPAYAAASTAIVVVDTGFVYFLFGDKNGFYVVTKSGSTYYLNFATQMLPAWSSALAVTANSESPGSGVEIEVDTVAPFEAGKKYQIVNFNSATGVPELVTVSSVGASSIVVASLANTHPAGAKIGELPCRLVVSNASTSSWPGNCYGWSEIGASVTVGLMTPPTTQLAYIDPDSWYGYYWLWPHIWAGVNGQIYGASPSLYRVGSGSLSSEDTIVVNGVTYKHFEVNGSAYVCVKEG